MYKPRILWVGEASYLNTGYSVYARNTLSRLQQTGKYILARLLSVTINTFPSLIKLPIFFTNPSLIKTFTLFD